MVAAPSTTLRLQTASGSSPFSSSEAFAFGNADSVNILSYQKIGDYQTATFSSPTKGNISVGARFNNIKYLTSSTAEISALAVGTGTGPTLSLINIPNYCASLNVRTTSSISIKVNKCNVYFHNGSTSGVSPTQFDIKYYECFNVSTGTGVSGSGLTSWGTIAASSTSFVPLRANPGVSGTNASGSVTAGTQHDWYFCFSATPVRTYSAVSFNVSCMIEYV
jgi:hypothetical protein